MLAPRITSDEDLLRLCERLRSAIADEAFAPRENLVLPVSISLGAVRAADPEWTVESLLETADQALYAAKTAGRNCSRLADPQAPASTRPR